MSNEVRHGSNRKFSAGVGLTALNATLLWFDQIDAAAFSNLVMFIWGGYFIANVVDKRGGGLG